MDTIWEPVSSSGGKSRHRHPTAKVKGGWTPEEDALLVRLVKKFGEGNWSPIARALNECTGKDDSNGRIGKQCRERYNHHLHPGIRKDPWTTEEEQLVVDAHKRLGNKWSDIARCIVGRSENAVKNHWNATLRKRVTPECPAGPLKLYLDSLNLAISPRRRGAKRKRSRTPLNASGSSEHQYGRPTRPAAQRSLPAAADGDASDDTTDDASDEDFADCCPAHSDSSARLQELPSTSPASTHPTSPAGSLLQRSVAAAGAASSGLALPPSRRSCRLAAQVSMVRLKTMVEAERQAVLDEDLAWEMDDVEGQDAGCDDGVGAGAGDERGQQQEQDGSYEGATLSGLDSDEDDLAERTGSFGNGNLPAVHAALSHADGSGMPQPHAHSDCSMAPIAAAAAGCDLEHVHPLNRHLLPQRQPSSVGMAAPGGAQQQVWQHMACAPSLAASWSCNNIPALASQFTQAPGHGPVGHRSPALAAPAMPWGAAPAAEAGPPAVHGHAAGPRACHSGSLEQPLDEDCLLLSDAGPEPGSSPGMRHVASGGALFTLAGSSAEVADAADGQQKEQQLQQTGVVAMPAGLRVRTKPEGGGRASGGGADSLAARPWSPPNMFFKDPALLGLDFGSLDSPLMGPFGCGMSSGAMCAGGGAGGGASADVDSLGQGLLLDGIFHRRSSTGSNSPLLQLMTHGSLQQPAGGEDAEDRELWETLSHLNGGNPGKRARLSPSSTPTKAQDAAGAPGGMAAVPAPAPAPAPGTVASQPQLQQRCGMPCGPAALMWPPQAQMSFPQQQMMPWPTIAAAGTNGCCAAPGYGPYYGYSYGYGVMPQLPQHSGGPQMQMPAQAAPPAYAPQLVFGSGVAAGSMASPFSPFSAGI